MPNITPYTQKTVPGLPGSTPMARFPNLEVPSFSGLTKVIDFVKDRNEEQGRAWATEALSKARLDWAVEFRTRQENAESGAPDFTPNIIKDYDDYLEKTVSSAPTESAKKYIHERLHDLRSQIASQATAFEAAARIDYRDTKFNSSIDNYQKLVAMDPSQYDIALAEQLAVIDSSALPPKQKADMRQKAINGISKAVVWGQLQASPTAFLESIGMYTPPTQEVAGVPVVMEGEKRSGTWEVIGPDGKAATENFEVNVGRLPLRGNKAYDMLPFEERISMLSEALSLKARIDANADRLAERERKRIASEAMKQAWDRMFQGSGAPPIDRKFIESIRPVISDDEYKSLLVGMREAQSGEGMKSDPDVFRELQGALYSNPESVRQRALTAHRNRLLTNTDLSAILTKADDLDREKGPKSEFERSRAKIINKLDPGPFVQDPIGKGRFADALYEFDSWVEQKQRTDEEIAKRADQIVNQYRFINLDDTIAGLPKPRFGEIRRKPGDPAGMLQDIAKSFEATKKALAEKRITKEEYLEEASRLNKWRKAVTDQGR